MAVEGALGMRGRMGGCAGHIGRLVRVIYWRVELRNMYRMSGVLP